MKKNIYFINWHNGLNTLNGPTNVFNSLVKEITQEDNIKVICPETFNSNFTKAVNYIMSTFSNGEENVYCVNSDGLKMPYVIYLLSRIHKKHKYYMMVHGFRRLEDKFVGLDKKNYYRLESYILKNFQNLICVSNFSKSMILQYTQRKKPTYVIHNGVDLIDYIDLNKEKHMEKEIRLIMSGGVKKLKGALETVNLVTSLNNKNRPYRVTLDVYGKFDDKVFFDSFLEAINNKDYIKYHGCVDKDELYEAYKRAHFLIALSYLDSFNMTVVEAMANGTVPIITENVGACEFVDENKSGFIVKLDDYYGRIEEILDSSFYKQEKYLNIVKNAYDKSKEISWRHKLNEYIELFYKDKN